MIWKSRCHGLQIISLENWKSFEICIRGHGLTNDFPVETTNSQELKKCFWNSRGHGLKVFLPGFLCIFPAWGAGDLCSCKLDFFFVCKEKLSFITIFERFIKVNFHLFSYVYKLICFSILGLVRSRDGSRLSPNTQTYMSLPSPNIQSAKVSASIFVTAIRVEGQNYKSWFMVKLWPRLATLSSLSLWPRLPILV